MKCNGGWGLAIEFHIMKSYELYIQAQPNPACMKINNSGKQLVNYTVLDAPNDVSTIDQSSRRKHRLWVC